MPHEMKKRGVLDRLKEKYIRAVRTGRLRNPESVTLELALNDFPRALRLTLDALGAILLEIEHENNERITVGPLNGGSTRTRREYYPVQVSSAAFPAELLTEVRPTVSEHDNNWCITLPGQTVMHPIGRVGSLKGELFAVMGRNMGHTMGVDELLQLAGRGVTDPRTEDPDMADVSVALREINRTMHAAIRRRMHLRDGGPHRVRIVWKHMLWNAILFARRGRMMVGIVRGENPPTRRKRK